MAADWEAEHFAEVLEKVPLGRSGSAEDIAAGVQFLLEHATLTGHVLHGWRLVNECVVRFLQVLPSCPINQAGVVRWSKAPGLRSGLV